MDQPNHLISLSIVVPLFNEELTVHEMVKRLHLSCSKVTKSYELVLVNDGSADNTLASLKELAANDPMIRYVSFSRNFGHQNAVLAGIAHAKGDAIVLIDGDLQDPPELIPDMYNKYLEGYKVVYARRIQRRGETAFKKATAKAFYKILKKITNFNIPVDTGDFRLISREVADHLLNMNESSKFLRGQIAWLGFRQTGIEFQRDERKAGKTKYTLKKMMKLALDGITSFSNFPLQIATFLGFIFSFFAFLIILYALYSKFILHEVVTGWTSLMISSMFIGGIQLLCIGIIGEYISRISNDVKKRPPYIVEETNCSEKP
ncbi:MAG TPA: glycosyltransferase family 2 protein [Lentimicrobium sp.]|nr:glycosyltransferase family 2 protein [Lentimicrobium sp.]